MSPSRIVVCPKKSVSKFGQSSSGRSDSGHHGSIHLASSVMSFRSVLSDF